MSDGLRLALKTIFAFFVFFESDDWLWWRFDRIPFAHDRTGDIRITSGEQHVSIGKQNSRLFQPAPDHEVCDGDGQPVILRDIDVLITTSLTLQPILELLAGVLLDNPFLRWNFVFSILEVLDPHFSEVIHLSFLLTIPVRRLNNLSAQARYNLFDRSLILDNISIPDFNHFVNDSEQKYIFYLLNLV